MTPAPTDGQKLQTAAALLQLSALLQAHMHATLASSSTQKV